METLEPKKSRYEVLEFLISEYLNFSRNNKDIYTPDIPAFLIFRSPDFMHNSNLNDIEKYISMVHAALRKIN